MMSDQQDQIIAVQRPATDDRKEWKAYWESQGMPWRTEPEIDTNRQYFLRQRLQVKPDKRQGIYAFRDTNGSLELSRADVEWLLARSNSSGLPGSLDRPNRRQHDGEGLDLRGATFIRQDLRGLPLEHIVGGLSVDQAYSATDKELEDASICFQDTILRNANLEGAMLSGARFYHVDLINTHMSHVQLSKAYLYACRLRYAHMEFADLTFCKIKQTYIDNVWLEGANLSQADLSANTLHVVHLQGAKVWKANFRDSTLRTVNFSGARLSSSHFEGATFAEVHVEWSRLVEDDLRRVRKLVPEFPDTLTPTDMRGVYFDSSTALYGLKLGDRIHGFPRMAYVRWGGVNLDMDERLAGVLGGPNTVKTWSDVNMLGDETVARTRTKEDGTGKDRATRLREFAVAVRANRQLAMALRAQGLNEDADRFAYKAQKLQREVLQRQQRYIAAVGSWLLDVVAGYGYKPMRTLTVYLLALISFAVAYFILGQVVGPHLSPLGAFVFSMTSFHGRGFFPGGIVLDDPITVLAALEAFVGLVVEVSFIATFTQRFFAR